MTTEEIFRFLVEFPWIVFITYWVVAALKTRRTRSREPFASRFAVLLIEVAGFVLLFADWAGVGWLGSKFLPRTLASAGLGVALTWLGVGLAIWARYHLAEYWSARITLKEDHQLICTGPYARLRHPIYSGVVLAALGSAVVIDKWRCVVGVGLVLTGYCLKGKREEKLLSQQFGDAFQEHRKHTGFMFPHFS
jgi:protein-S-isoprenylcysteine O-methyltransferase Ste14